MTQALKKGPSIRAFNSKPSSAYLKALRALQKLAETEPDNVLRVYAEATAQNLEESWTKRNGVHRSGSSPCIRRITHGACLTMSRMQQCRCRPPGVDHVDMWIKDRKAAMLTSQPYHMSWESLAETVDFCRAYDLRADILPGASWYFPGWTLLVEFHRQDEPIGW